MSGRRLRAPHPIVVLRWLRAGVLGVVVVTTLLYLVVDNRTGEQNAAADRTNAALGHIKEASKEAKAAKAALEAVARTRAMHLTGTGGDFANATASVSSHLTSAAEGNGAGEQGLSHIQFVQGQLATCVQMANTAVLDTQPGLTTALDALDDKPEYDGEHPIAFTGGLRRSLEDLEKLEATAHRHQLDSGWRSPGLLWPLFIGPTAVMLMLVCASGYLIAHRFRQYPSPAFAVALAAQTSISIAMCTRSYQPPAALALPALAAAGALAYLAYRPRLAEYRFPRS
ncbi:hypothetical protein [Streptomyces sp. NPDC020996]|uniref:hypothetical protein n=1 Tax=Streptomyces sp. NPDC020996 TaxID=3154791 RepID=UPI0033EA64E7